jgi:dihydroorotate dehydrogenase
VTEEAQPGNPERPRQHIFGEELGRVVCKNDLRFNSPGALRVALNLEEYSERPFPIIGNIGQNSWIKAKDMAESFARVVGVLYKYVDGFQLVFSCPNIHGPEEVHKMQEYAIMSDSAKAVNQVMDAMGERKPVDIKVGADSTRKEIDSAIRIAQENNIGIVAINTSNDRDVISKYGEKWLKVSGGFSGDDPDFRLKKNIILAYIYTESEGKIPLRAAGGNRNGPTVLVSLMAGAQIAEFVVALRDVEAGMLGVADRTNRWLSKYMDENGLCSLGEVVGVSAQRIINTNYTTHKFFTEN